MCVADNKPEDSLVQRLWTSAHNQGTLVLQARETKAVADRAVVDAEERMWADPGSESTTVYERAKRAAWVAEQNFRAAERALGLMEHGFSMVRRDALVKDEDTERWRARARSVTIVNTMAEGE